MRANRVWALVCLPLVVVVSITSCGKANLSKDQKEAAVDSQRLGSDPCANGLIEGPQGSEPVPVLPVDGQPGYEPVPPSPGAPGGQITPSSAGQPNLPPAPA